MFASVCVGCRLQTNLQNLTPERHFLLTVKNLEQGLAYMRTPYDHMLTLGYIFLIQVYIIRPSCDYCKIMSLSGIDWR